MRRGFAPLLGWAAVLAGVASAPAIAQVVAPAGPADIAAVPATDDPALALALGAVDDRMTVPVTIGTAGPWDFVIDTGAERTVVARELAQLLDLRPGPPVHVTAMAGSADVRTAIVPHLAISSLAPPTVAAPMLEREHLGAAGMIGLDALQGQQVAIDFDRQVMTVTASHRRQIARTSPDEIVVVAKSAFGQLIVTDARCRGRRIAVVIDTGSAITVGNSALLELMAGHARPIGPVRSESVLGQTLTAAGYRVDDLTIGGVGFAGVPVAIADVQPFRRFGLANTPALMLGMDALRLFRSVNIDFANREIRFQMPRRPAGQDIRFAI